ncbi:hypothetical protein J2S43_001926 [Catenuloplanes nepalensis]|uniref:Uncharacterized protein n=1 Tax=Catenuloplanes nepalensis TaxID=587533 RepID=A0ABT9MPT1_9ACTN|nr:hypothetical protein [Catenuloplanes nepalensis]MDP9793414.1 hypothetical protein [Catenuloplanes nepalensis]
MRSLLSPDVALRVAAVLLAALIVVRSLLDGVSGIGSIVLVLASAGLFWGLVRLAARLRVLLAESSPEASRLTSRLVSRARARLAAVLAILVLVVHTAITGYLGVWTILIALTLAAVATLLSPDLRLVAVLGGTAAVFGTATVFLADVFQGSTEARALAVSIAAIVLPVLVSDKIVAAVRRPALSTTHHAILAVLTLLIGFLGWTRSEWLPGVTHGCYTLPTTTWTLPVSTGITMLRATPDGRRCYGLLDTADPGVFAARAFGRDPVTIDLQRRILELNEPLKDGDLTVVWLGALSCDPLPADESRCADGRDYPSERDQLRALMFAQTLFIATERDKRLHVVIADATQDVAHADAVAEMIVQRRDAMGERLVVIGGGDSRDVTQRAINLLLDAQIPFIAPNLLADLGEPDAPFVNRPGYLQLASPNRAYAEDVVDGLSFADGYRLDVHQVPNPTDQYTTSLVNDLLAVVKEKNDPRVTARHVAALDRIDASVCKDAEEPTVLYFADRWTRFAEFVQRVNEVCGHSRPRLVIADVSVSRFMANDQLRAVSNADWPVDYHVGGPSCADLTEQSLRTITEQVYASRDLTGLAENETFACANRDPAAKETGELLDACPLDAAVKLDCRPNDLGTYLIPAWDAVFLADALLPDRRVPLNGLRVTTLPLSTVDTVASVERGRLLAPTIDIRMWHADPLNDPRRIYERPSDALLRP